MIDWCKKKYHEQRISELIPRLYSIAHSWGCKQDVCDDLVQETVTTALVKYKQLRDPKALNCWVIRILVNSHRQYLRKNRWLTTIDDEKLVHDHGPAEEFESAHTVGLVRAAIHMLSPEHQKVLILVDMESLSYREVADVLDIKIGTVMSRLGRARNKLKKILTETNSIVNQVKEDSNTKNCQPVNLRSVT